METGTIVVSKHLVFSDGKKDTKKNRPCIFLFDKIIGSKKYAYIMPLTTNIDKFNRDYSRYILIPDAIFKENKLSFARADGIVCVPTEGVISRGIRLDNKIITQLLNRIKSYMEERPYTNKMEETIKTLENKQYSLTQKNI